MRNCIHGDKKNDIPNHSTNRRSSYKRYCFLPSKVIKMSMVKLGDGIVEINGQAGGDVWRSDQCGQHVQAPPRHVARPPTTNQRKRQRAFRTCMSRIREGLTVEQVAAWQQYANMHSTQNKKGEVRILAWHQMFCKINVIRLYNDLPLTEYPPE